MKLIRLPYKSGQGPSNTIANAWNRCGVEVHRDSVSYVALELHELDMIDVMFVRWCFLCW